MQDDAWPADRFPSRMRTAIREKPNDMLAFFAPGAGAHRARINRARARGETWALLHSMWYPTVALLWPRQRVTEFLAWIEAGRVDPEKTVGDDGPVGSWAQHHHVQVWATIPSLVQHPDTVPSLHGRASRNGENRARVAACWEG